MADVTSWGESDEYRRERRSRERRRDRYEERSRSRSRERRRRRRDASVERRRRESSPRRQRRDHRAFPDGYIEPRRIFVGGVPKVTTEERFRTHFEQFGRVERVELTAARSFGFVTFVDQDSVERALERRMHPFKHTNNNVAYIEVRRPMPKTSKRHRNDTTD
ncbi:hypothetical protein CTAYLR_009632 [Chrysophaeum taylorii]|uniref:RRM domain-containing protein n=1 Tax=Chrysophaeum taylorii TaxID=2483200 RepID=A0AAD7UIE2_9STRA|nr:hypothetical protein CTAYLR_009632 [Chrysophaeum taylorii]